MLTQQELSAFLGTYSVGFLYTNASVVIGHPAERLKVASQLAPHLSYLQSVKPVFKAGFSGLFAGFYSCAVRQNVKITYRSFLMTGMPRKVDELQLGNTPGAMVKAAIAGAVDTAIATPFENVKLLQMRALHHETFRHAVGSIFRARGVPGFFYGMTSSFWKSFPTWAYLFWGYEMTKSKREQQGFGNTILWATLASVPMTMLTTPFDVVKTLQQGSLAEKRISDTARLREVINKHGFFSIFRGFPFRLVHKSMATATAYAVMDVGHRLSAGK